MYRICWKASDNSSGNGEYCLTFDNATAWVTKMNEKYPDIKHWMELSSLSSTLPPLVETPLDQVSLQQIEQPPSAT